MWAPARQGAAWGHHGGAAAALGAGGSGPLVKSLERDNIWKMQDLRFRHSTGCCEDSQASVQQVHQCVEHCHAPLAQAQALGTSELEKFQDCLAQCTMHCNNKAKDSMDARSKELQVKRQLESCIIQVCG
ncbi:hypothetical protein EI555_008259 [Monodon monoceros]|uniref:Protein FAM136A n=1 Tax=Monodon monoceros TaxID=40151 RepID=A0A4U1F0I4_MONMO|nr:hypothetical protein EI555_008259 [Monodon monoceros]